jgi:hypothetical protein
MKIDNSVQAISEVELPLSFKKNDEGDVYARKTEFILFKFIK